MIAVPAEDGAAITVYGSMQCPYYVHRALKVLLGLPGDSVRVVQTETGGGFGGKEEYPSMIAGHAALLALKARRPVKMVYDRVEDMLATTKRHPGDHPAPHRRHARRPADAMDIDVLLDGGAYVTLSAVVLSRGCIHAAGPYRCDHVRIRGRAVMTNTPPNGAFRGFGAPQTQFAVEVHMDRIAEALGMDPVRLREHQRAAPRRHDRHRPAARTRLQRARRCCARRSSAPTSRARREALAGTNRGIGLSLFFHGSGFTGCGEVQARVAGLAGADRARRAHSRRQHRDRPGHAHHARADRGRHARRAVRRHRGERRRHGEVPDSGPTVASRTCMVVGRILQRCAEEMRERLGALTPRDYLRKHGPLVVTKQYEKPPEIAWDDDTYSGDAYGSYGWGCDVVEVEVDRDTWQVRPIAFTTVHEIGKAIHPLLAAGRSKAARAQGLGWALLEEVVMRDGRMANSQLTNYIIPTTLDTPAIDVVMLENPYAHGPFGAKGVGEMPIDGPAPAVVNALRHAGFDLREIPATPERLMVMQFTLNGSACASTRIR